MKKHALIFLILTAFIFGCKKKKNTQSSTPSTGSTTGTSSPYALVTSTVAENFYGVLASTNFTAATEGSNLTFVSKFKPLLLAATQYYLTIIRNL